MRLYAGTSPGKAALKLDCQFNHRGHIIWIPRVFPFHLLSRRPRKAGCGGARRGERVGERRSSRHSAREVAATLGRRRAGLEPLVRRAARRIVDTRVVELRDAHPLRPGRRVAVLGVFDVHPGRGRRVVVRLSRTGPVLERGCARALRTEALGRGRALLLEAGQQIRLRRGCRLGVRLGLDDKAHGLGDLDAALATRLVLYRDDLGE
mmetsp:Transcript_2799/g.8226  ORF Transcript_2799/g.8226 Transcript_2799/m.8226 type:complete len:207 (-) Transcript_2799:581-1201(-)